MKPQGHFFGMEIFATWNKQLKLELIYLLRPVLSPNCCVGKCIYLKACAETVLHLGTNFSVDQFNINVTQIHMTQCEEGRSYLWERECSLSARTPTLPHTTSDAWKLQETKSIWYHQCSCDLAALVCLALWHVCLKRYPVDRVTESMNKQKFLLMVHPCGKPSKFVWGYLEFCYFSISKYIQLDSAGFV